MAGVGDGGRAESGVLVDEFSVGETGLVEAGEGCVFVVEEGGGVWVEMVAVVVRASEVFFVVGL